MRALLGMAFILIGAIVGYQVLTGKFPSSVALPGTPGNAVPTPTTSNSVVVGGTQHAPGHGPASPTGIPTMQHLNDLIASNGGM